MQAVRTKEEVHQDVGETGNGTDAQGKMGHQRPKTAITRSRSTQDNTNKRATTVTSVPHYPRASDGDGPPCII